MVRVTSTHAGWGRPLSTLVPWSGGGRITARAVVIGAIALVLGTTKVAQAGVNFWTSHWPDDNGGVYALAIDPTTPSTLYAGTAGLYKSTNGGGSWSAANTGLTDPSTGFASVVRALAIDPTMPGTLYAGTGQGGVYKSTNGGSSWSAANTGLTDPSTGFTYAVTALAIDPTTPSTLYAGIFIPEVGFGGVYKSTNSGGNWSVTGLSGTGVYVPTLAIDPSTPSTLYAGKGQGGVHKSTNGGGTWSAVNTGLTDPATGFFESVNSLAIDPSMPSTLYAGITYGGVRKSTNGGGSWSAVNAGLADPTGGAYDVSALAIDPTSSSTLYAGTMYIVDKFPGGGVFRSTNSGGSWSALNTGLSGNALYVPTLVIDPSTPSTLYAGTFGGAFAIQQVAACGGDCNMDGQVTVDEVLALVNIALGTADIASCAAGDANHDNQVTIDEIIAAVDHAMNGCAG